MIVYHVRANRFLQGMVRALVGTMVNVGRGHTAESEFSVIMEARKPFKSRSGSTGERIVPGARNLLNINEF
jgi:tRNA U38,U39,U40 pseudouridine synthase TruA